MKTRIFPPAYLNFLVILEVALHFFWPLRQFVRPPFTYLGGLLIAIGILLNIYSTRYLARQNTTSNFHEIAQRLVKSGPFSRSRNPIYLSGIVITFGIALVLGSLSTFLIPLILFLILNSFHIPDEERRLEQLFGKDYLAYKQRVRRWF